MPNITTAQLNALFAVPPGGAGLTDAVLNNYDALTDTGGNKNDKRRLILRFAAENPARVVCVGGLNGFIRARSEAAKKIIARIPTATPEALAAVAEFTTDAETLSMVIAHDNCDDAGFTAVAGNDHTATPQLKWLTGLNDRDLDALLVLRQHMVAVDLAAIAVRRHAEPAILVNIDAHPLHADALVAAALQVARLDGPGRTAMAQQHAVATEEQLQALTLLNDPLLDAEIAQCAHTRPEDLAEIAVRNPDNAGIIASITAHQLNVAKNPLVVAALIRAGRLVEARTPATAGPRLHELTELNDALIDVDLAQHLKTRAEDLAVLAIRHAANVTIVGRIQAHGTHAGHALVLAALAVAPLTAAERLAMAQAGPTTAVQLQALTLAKSAALDAAIAQHLNTRAEDLAEIAIRRASTPAIIASITGHALNLAHNPIVGAALIRAGRLLEARDGATGEDRLHALTELDDPLMDVDLARHLKTRAEDLAVLAIRNADDATIVGYIHAHGTHAAHALVVAAVAVARLDGPARLVLAQDHANTTAEQLQALTLLKNLALDADIVQCQHTRAEDLAEIAIRYPDNAAIIGFITAHPLNVAKNPRVVAALIRAGHLVEARDAATVEVRLTALTELDDPLIDVDLAQHLKTRAEDLAVLAIRNADDETIVGYIHAHGTLAAHALVVAAVAVARLDGPARLVLAQDHANTTAEQLQALTLLKDLALDADIVQCAHARAEDLAEIAVRRAGNVAIINHIRGHAVNAADPLVVAALIKAGRLVEARTPATAGPRLHELTELNDPLIDADLARHLKTEAEDLAVLAIRHAKNPTIVGRIQVHGTHAGHALVVAALAVAPLDAAARLAMAQAGPTTAVELQALTIAKSAALDAAIAQHLNTRAEDLAEIAVRNPDNVAIIGFITAHPLNVAKNPRVVAALALASQLVEARNGATLEARLTALTAVNNPLLDAAIARHAKTRAEDLAVLAIRHEGDEAILALIDAHPLNLAPNALVVAALAVARLDGAARTLLAQAHAGTTAEQLQALTLLEDLALDEHIVQCDHTRAEDLAEIAVRRAGNVAIINHIRGHAVHAADPLVVAALIRAGRLVEARNVATLGPALHVLTELDDPLIDVDLAQHLNTRPEDLVVLAIRHENNPTILAHIKALPLYADALLFNHFVVDAVSVAEATGLERTAMAQAHAGATAGQLQALTLLKDLGLDAEIAKCAHTRAEDLAEIAIRRASTPEIIASIKLHPLAKNPRVGAALIRAGRLVEARNVATLGPALHVLTELDDPLIDVDLVRHAKTTAEDLAILAIRHENNPAILALIDAHPLNLAPNALVVAALAVARRDAPARLALAQAHAGTSAEELQALTLLKNLALDEHIVRCANTRAEDLAEIAIRRASEPAIIANIRLHPLNVALNPRVVAALARVDRLVEARDGATLGPALHALIPWKDALIDEALVQHGNTEAVDLATLAIRYEKNPAILARIDALPRHVDPLVAAALTVARYTPAARLAMAKQHAVVTAEHLHALTLVSSRALDLEIVRCAHVRAEDLRDIALGRPDDAVIIGYIKAHALYLTADPIVVAALTLAAQLVKVRTAATTPAVLHTLMAVNDPLLDIELAQHPHIAAADLAELAIRYEGDEEILWHIGAHQLTVTLNPLVVAALAIARATPLARTGRAQDHVGATAQELQALTLLDDPLLDVEIARCANVRAEDLAEIAMRNPGHVAIIGHVTAHPLNAAHNPLVVAALILAPHLAAAEDHMTAPAALKLLTAVNNPRLDVLLAQHTNTAPEDLAELAIRHAANPTMVGYIHAHATHHADALVVAAVAVAREIAPQRLVRAQNPGASAEELQALTLVNNSALDLEIARRPNTRREDLDAILRRTANPNVLAALARHGNVDAAMTIRIVKHAQTNPGVVTAVRGGAHSADVGVIGAIAALTPAVRMVFSDLASDVATAKITPSAAAAGLNQANKAKLATLTAKKKWGGGK